MQHNDATESNDTSQKHLLTNAKPARDQAEPNSTNPYLPCTHVEGVPKKRMVPYKGYLFAVLSAICSAVAATFIKKAQTFSATDAAIVRYLAQLISMFFIIKSKDLPLLGPKKQRKLLILRGILGTGGLVFFFFAIKLVPPSDCISIAHSSLIITSILARFVLKEKLTISHIVALFLTLSGMLFIAKPVSIFGSAAKRPNFPLQNSTSFNQTIPSSNEASTDKFYLILGIMFAVGHSFCHGIVQILMKKLSTNNVHFSLVTIFTSYFGIPVSAIISVILVLTGIAHKDFAAESEHLLLHSIYVLCGAFIGVLTQIAINLAYKHEEASKVAIVRTIDVFFSFIIQYFMLNIVMDVFSIIGSVLIVSGTFLVLSMKLLDNKLNRDNECKLDNEFKMDDYAEYDVEKRKLRSRSGNLNPCIRCVQFKF
jgi:drug/metabolite transporter (DMT)-like permease